MTENSPLIGPRRGADNLRSASAADGDDSGLKNAAAGANLGLIEPSKTLLENLLAPLIVLFNLDNRHRFGAFTVGLSLSLESNQSFRE